MNSQSFRRFAAFAAILSLPLAFGSFVVGLAAVDFDMAAFSDPLMVIRTGAQGAELWRWGMLLDMLGYYLLIIPLVLVLMKSLRARSPDWMGLFTFCMFGYCLIGAVGAAILAAALPPLIEAWQTAAEGQRLIFEIAFTSFMNAIYRGVWKILEELIAGVGWVGIGLLLRHERRVLGITTIVLGIACLVDSLGSMLDSEALAMPGLYAYLLLAPIWACWLGIILLRKPLAPAVE